MKQLRVNHEFLIVGTFQDLVNECILLARGISMTQDKQCLICFRYHPKSSKKSSSQEFKNKIHNLDDIIYISILDRFEGTILYHQKYFGTSYHATVPVACVPCILMFFNNYISLNTTKNKFKAISFTQRVTPIVYNDGLENMSYRHFGGPNSTLQQAEFISCSEVLMKDLVSSLNKHLMSNVSSSASAHQKNSKDTDRGSSNIVSFGMSTQCAQRSLNNRKDTVTNATAPSVTCSFDLSYDQRLQFMRLVLLITYLEITLFVQDNKEGFAAFDLSSINYSDLFQENSVTDEESQNVFRDTYVSKRIELRRKFYDSIIGSTDPIALDKFNSDNMIQDLLLKILGLDYCKNKMNTFINVSSVSSTATNINMVYSILWLLAEAFALRDCVNVGGHFDVKNDRVLDNTLAFITALDVIRTIFMENGYLQQMRLEADSNCRVHFGFFLYGRKVIHEYALSEAKIEVSKHPSTNVNASSNASSNSLSLMENFQDTKTHSFSNNLLRFFLTIIQLGNHPCNYRSAIFENEESLQEILSKSEIHQHYSSYSRCDKCVLLPASFDKIVSYFFFLFYINSNLSKSMLLNFI